MKQRLLSQKMSQQAFDAVAERLQSQEKQYCEKYESFAKSFPALVHSCGLAQAVAFAQAKSAEKITHPVDYLSDLRSVLQTIGLRYDNNDAFANALRTEPMPAYLRISRNALQASSWIKRYVEAGTEPVNEPGGPA